MCCPKGKCGCQYFILLVFYVKNPGPHEYFFFKVNNMKYWHQHLPFGQHISVSTLVKEKKIRKSKGTTKNRKFRCVVYMSNELISEIICLSFWLLVLFSVLFVNCGDNVKVYFSIVTHEIPLRVRRKKHVGLDAQSGRQ